MLCARKQSKSETTQSRSGSASEADTGGGDEERCAIVGEEDEDVATKNTEGVSLIDDLDENE